MSAGLRPSMTWGQSVGYHVPSERRCRQPGEQAGCRTTPASRSRFQDGWHTLAQQAPPQAESPRRATQALVTAALLLVAAALLRCFFGIDFGDGAHYTVVAVRLAGGARPYIDEMTLQVTGFLLDAIFAKAWMAVFGLAGIQLAMRVFYVVLASGAGFVVFRALRPSFGDWPSFAAAAIPLLAPPFNLMQLSYNTGAILGLMLAAALGLAAIRDRSRWAALGAGVALSYSAVAYPPLAIGALVGFAAFAFAARDRKLSLWFLGGGLGLAVVVVAYLATVTNIAALSKTLAFSAEGASSVATSLGAKLRSFAKYAAVPLTRANALPMWLLAIVALLPWAPSRRWVRGAALALVPLAAGLPPLLAYTPPSQGYYGIVPAVMLVSFTAAVAVPVTWWAVSEKRAGLLTLLVLTAPVAVVDTILVLISTSAGYQRGTVFAGLAPLTLALIAGWAVFIHEHGGVPALIGGVVSFAVIVVVLLFATSHLDDVPLRLDTRIASGANAGLVTTAAQAQQLAELEAVAKRVVNPGDGVLVVDRPIAYLLVGGRIDSNATWVALGPSDHFTLDYFAARSDSPRSVFVAAAAADSAQPSDPLMQYLHVGYVRHGDAGGFQVWTHR
jgi:hypothetical protein